MKILKSIAVLALAAMLPLQTLAAPAVVYDGTTVTLSGTMDSGTASPITVIVTKPASDGSERPSTEITGATTLAALANVVEFMGVIDPADGGVITPYAITLNETLPSGWCAVYVNQLGENTLTRVGAFDHVSATQLANLVASFNSDAADYATLLSDSNLTILSKVGAKKIAYDSLTNQSAFQTILKGYRPFVQTGNDSAVAYFVKSFNEAIALAELKTSARATLENADYKGTYWTTDLTSGDFIRLSSDKQNAIVTAVANATFAKASEVDAFVAEQTGLAVLSELCLQRTDIDNFLQSYGVTFGLTTLNDNYGNPLPALSTFDDYGKARIFASILADKGTMTNKTNVQNAYRSAVVTEMSYEPPTNDNGYSGGGGSYSGGGGGGSYTPSVKVEVETQQTYKAMPFYDVAQAHWAYGYIDKMYKLGAVSGRNDGSFGPEDSVLREELVKMICGVMGINAVDEPTGFADADEGAWYSPFITAAVRANLISGTGDGNFGIGRALSRQDAAVILCRAAGLNASGIPNFTDNSDIAPYAIGSVAAASAAGLINGYGDGSFGAEKTVTRAEISAMLCRLAEMKGE